MSINNEVADALNIKTGSGSENGHMGHLTQNPKLFRGAMYDLQSQINRHLFLLCPNNSGSTFLSKAIATSKRVWSLHREGQHVHGFSGPKTARNHYALIWNAKENWSELFSNPADYNWELTKKAWYFQATAHSQDADNFFTKSPPFLLIPERLQVNFENTSFIFMVRNPYAVVEGIVRNKTNPNMSRDTILTLAAKHIVRCLERQKHNIAKHADNSVFFTYEQMCDDPQNTQQKLTQRFPELLDLNLDQQLSVKGNYDEPLRNMNEQQISRLSTEDIELINSVFGDHKPILEHFGYELIDATL